MLRPFLIPIYRLLFSFVFKFKRAFLLPTKPLFINFPVTYQCNFRCLMCNIWQRYLKDKNKIKEELALEDFSHFLKGNKDWLSQVRHIGLTGGEAFLRQDLVEIIKLMRQELPQAEIGIQTNGFLPDYIEKKLKEILGFYPNLSLAVSLDGISKIHDRIRGVKGAYQNALKTIKLARNLGIKDITCGMTVSQDNYHQILEVRDVAEQFGCEFSCFLADEGDYFANKGKKLNLDKKAKEEVGKTLGNFSYHYYMDNLRLQLRGQRKRELPCYSGWTSIVIDPYGDVRPCILRSEVFGNIKRQALGEILTSQKARRIQELVKRCTCWSQCEISTSAVVDPWDVLRWFLFYADKKNFLSKLVPKLRRFT